MIADYYDSPRSPNEFYAVDADTVKQTIEEASIVFSCDMGDFIVHHGTLYDAHILIAEHKNQKADQLSGVWFAH